MKSAIFLSIAILLLPSFLRSDESLEREVYLMGTIFRVTVLETNRSRALSEMEAIIRVVEETEDQLSTWRETSELSKINRQRPGEKIEISESLCLLLSRLKEWTEMTEGAFDPTIGELLRIWGIQSSPKIPDDDIVKNSLQATGFQHIRQQQCSVEKDADVRFDAGAFGKGEALDRVIALIREKQFAPAVLDFGGQVAIAGEVPAITIPLADPGTRARNSTVALRLMSGSLSTSGGSEHDQIVRGKRVGHILDPRTGYPVPFFGSVTVWNQRALDADVLSTALYVMGPIKGYRWAENRNIAACFLFREKKKPLMTTAFRKLLR